MGVLNFRAKARLIRSNSFELVGFSWIIADKSFSMLESGMDNWLEKALNLIAFLYYGKIMEKREERVLKQVRDFYDRNCREFSLSRGVWWPELDFIRKYLKKKGRILDFGCGNGRLRDFLQKEGFEGSYAGADISQGLIELAGQKYPRKEFVVLEKDGKLPFEKEAFDLIISVAVFHHLSPEMAEKSLTELKRVLKPGGRLILTAWHLWKGRYLKFWRGEFFLQKRLFSGEIPFGKDKQQKRWCYWWTLGGLERILKKNGFRLVESGTTRSGKQEKRNYWVVGEKE